MFTPPLAKTIPHRLSIHGRELDDPYAWLQDKDNPDVIDYLKAENAFAEHVLAHTEELQGNLFKEMRGRIQEDDQSAPERRGDYLYYWRIGKGQQYRVFCRKGLDAHAQEEVLLDENALAVGMDYCQVGVYEPSPDGRYLAYGVDTRGAWIFDLYVKDLSSGQIVSGPIPGAAWSVAWTGDQKSLFYTIFDAAHRPYQLLRHTIGSGSAQDILVFHEKDDAYMIFVERSRSGKFIFITIHSHSTSEVRFLLADEPEMEMQVIHPREHWLEYYVDHHDDKFIIRTNADGAENFKLMETDLDLPGRENWREVLSHRQETLIESIVAFKNHLVLLERTNGLRQLRISLPDGLRDVHYVRFPDPVYTLRLDENREYQTAVVRFFYSSLVTPESTVDYEMSQKLWQVQKQQQIPSGYRAEEYTSERLMAPSHDGLSIPISIVYRKGIQQDGSSPLLLYGYGSYGYSQEPRFDFRKLSLLDRGFIFAIAHVRGGSEMGRAWYENGRLSHKKNTFKDFIACAEHLIHEKYTAPGKLGIMGGSAGGLLVSAVANMRPDLLGAVVAAVPFTNVITAMMMPDLPLTVIEYEQWGNPNDPDAFDYMLSYSPYENVQPKDYPHIMVRAGLNDLQVPYWDPAKWVARLRSVKTDNNHLILLTNMAAGHGGSSGRYDHLKEDAQNYAFLIDVLGDHR